MFNLRQLKKIFGPQVTSARQSRKPPPTVKPRLEALEERWCPSTDTLVWNPVGGSQDAFNAANWYDQTQNKQGVSAPTQSNPIILDGNQANKSIEFSGGMVVASITVQNGYNSTLTIDAEQLDTNGGNVVVNSGCTLALVSKDPQGGIGLVYGSTFTVASGGTLKLIDGVATGVQFIINVDNMAGEFLNNAGTVTWTGTAVASGNQAIKDVLNTGVLNTGTFNADGGTNGDTTKVGAVLAIEESDANNTNNVSFYQTSGSLNLQNAAEVDAYDGYYQSGGSLTSDSTGGATQACTLVGGVGGDGDINIAGGNVMVDTVPNTVGTLRFIASTAEINAEVDVFGLTLQNGQSTLSDLLDCRGVGTVTLGASSDLNVGKTGTFALGTGNQWTVMKYSSGALKGSWGEINKPDGMTVSVGATQILVTN